jgi:hypothetical protein
VAGGGTGSAFPRHDPHPMRQTKLGIPAEHFLKTQAPVAAVYSRRHNSNTVFAAVNRRLPAKKVFYNRNESAVSFNTGLILKFNDFF